MEPTGDGFKLSTGREFDANRSILGIDPTELPLRLTEGYDSSVREDEPDYVNDKSYRDDAFTPAERQEIAEYMIALWRQWASQPHSGSKE